MILAQPSQTRERKRTVELRKTTVPKRLRERKTKTKTKPEKNLVVMRCSKGIRTKIGMG